VWKDQGYYYLIGTILTPGFLSNQSCSLSNIWWRSDDKVSTFSRRCKPAPLSSLTASIWPNRDRTARADEAYDAYIRDVIDEGQIKYTGGVEIPFSHPRDPRWWTGQRYVLALLLWSLSHHLPAHDLHQQIGCQGVPKKHSGSHRVQAPGCEIEPAHFDKVYRRTCSLVNAWLRGVGANSRLKPADCASKEGADGWRLGVGV